MARNLKRYYMYILLTFTVSFFHNAFAGEELEMLRQRKLNIYWTDIPPVIDGNMDDTCWQEAEAANDFRTFQRPAEKPTQQTEVRATYDASNLYLFYKFYEEEMDKLMYGPPEDMRDMLNFSADVLELFIDPGRTRRLYYQFAASPTAARFDMSKKKGRPFDPDWQVATAIENNYWTAEVSIPFRELAHVEEYRSTPQVGDVWGIQFCRSQGRLKEWSQWVPTPMGFHEVNLFGTAIFQGRKNAPNPPVVIRKDDENLHFGRGRMIFTSNSRITVNYILQKDGEVMHERTHTAEGELELPWHIIAGGHWEMLIQATADGEAVYTGRTRSNLPRINRLLSDIREQTAAASQKLTDFMHPVVNELKRKLEEIRKESAPDIEKLDRAGKLTNEEWQIILKNSGMLIEKWEEIKFAVNLVQFYPPGDTLHFFTLGTAGPYEKIYPFTLYNGEVKTPVRLSAAGGEYESFQIIVIPFWTELKDVKVEFSPLKGAAGTISPENLSMRLVDYVHLKGLAPDTDIHAIQPDILMPGVPFAVASGQVRSIWIDVYCPNLTPAGAYTGEVSVEANGQTVKIPLMLNSYGFNLPVKTSLENNFWFDPAGYGWGRFYGAGVYGKIPYTTDIYRKHAESLSRYRITAFPDSHSTMSPHLTIYHEGGGKFSFDFSKWEKFFRIGMDYGGNAFRASLSCNLGAMDIFRAMAIDRQTGEQTNLKQWIDPWKEKFDRGEAYYDTHPVWPQYLTALVDFLERTGLLEISSFEIYDEPNSNPRWLDMIRHQKWLREHVPSLPLANFGVYPARKQAGKKALGLHDVWAPHLTSITPESLEEMQQRRHKYGEKFWFYTCTETSNADGSFSPYLYYHRPYIGLRIHSWMAWQMQADGMLIFALNSLPDENIKTDPSERWPATPWVDGRQRGTGTLIYPGPDFEIIPSIRLVSARDGLEDYEYFKKLHDLSAYLNKDDHSELIKRVHEALRIEPEIIKDYYNWTKNVELLEIKRDEIAKLILEIKRWIEETL